VIVPHRGIAASRENGRFEGSRQEYDAQQAVAPAPRKEIETVMRSGNTLRIALASLLLGFAGSTLGCIAAPVVPPIGLAYTELDAPLAPRGEVGSKRGTSTVTAILFLVSTGDGSVRAAARNGGISDVKLVDYEYRNVLGVYQRYTTVVYGD
jgi:hypothetical protein